MDPDPDLTIVILGKTGVGKSAAGNTILGQAAFESELSFEPVTTEICEARGRVFGKQIRVIDTPGLLNSEDNEKKVKRFCENLMNSSRPCLFLVVIRVGRFTEEDQKAVTWAKEILGPEGLKRSYLLFTGGDTLKNQTLDDYIFPKGKDETKGKLPDVVEVFERKYHLFNNEEEDQKQVRVLLLKSGYFKGAFRDPWRKVSWGNNQENLDYAKVYQTKVNGIKHVRVLLYGPVGAGKSSFIGSVSNTLVRRMTHSAEANAQVSMESFTKKYKTHKIKKGDRGNYYPFVFNDVMGLEQTGGGVSVDDIKLAMMGHVKDGYKFNPSSSLSRRDPYYNPSPSPDDKVHVLVCVHSANSAEIEESIVQKMKEISEIASNLGIPQLAVLTKVDQACGETQKDLKNVYKSKYIEKKMKDFSSTLGVPMENIFPVKNYSEEDAIDDDIDTLILRVLRMITDFGDDFI